MVTEEREWYTQHIYPYLISLFEAGALIHIIYSNEEANSVHVLGEVCVYPKQSRTGVAFVIAPASHVLGRLSESTSEEGPFA